MVMLQYSICDVHFGIVKFMDFCQNSFNQRTNGPVKAHLISGPTVSTKTSFPNFDIVLKWVKVNSGSLFI